MQLVYICKEYFDKEKSCKSRNYLKGIISNIKCLLCIIKLEKYEDNNIICTIPYKKKISKKESNKIIRKIQRKINKNNSSIALCKGEEVEELKNILQENKYFILDGKWLFYYMISSILEYIVEKQGRKIEEYNMSILANEETKENKDKIINLAR